MKTYSVYFRTDSEFATRDFEAETPEQALTLARRFYDDDPSDLMFESYDDGCNPVDEIVIYDADENELAAWLDYPLRLVFSASALLAAAKLVVARWERGDLAAAVRQLDAAIAKATGRAQ